MSVPGKRTKTEIKQDAQEAIMEAIAKTLGYYDPNEYGQDYEGDELEALRAEVQKQADRVARMFGYVEAWSA